MRATQTVHVLQEERSSPAWTDAPTHGQRAKKNESHKASIRGEKGRETEDRADKKKKKVKATAWTAAQRRTAQEQRPAPARLLCRHPPSRPQRVPTRARPGGARQARQTAPPQTRHRSPRMAARKSCVPRRHRLHRHYRPDYRCWRGGRHAQRDCPHFQIQMMQPQPWARRRCRQTPPGPTAKVTASDRQALRSYSRERRPHHPHY